MSKGLYDLVKPGDVLDGKYTVERVIGQGGMGIVVAARHRELHQRVAIKLLRASQAQDPELVERFLREARAVARLKSDHAVKVIDVGRRKNGSPFIVMELLNGEDLGAVVERGPLPIAEATDYVLQACEAVAEAHALGIVHRDLKPRNLFLTSRVGGRPLVKVLDFGLAKRMDIQDRALTATAAVMGSPQYMSPEQMRASRDVDFRTDIWSLGVCLYELVSGRVPFDADAVPVLCAMVLKDPPPPIQSIRADVPLALWSVLETCLQKEPARRYSNVAELAAVIEGFAPPGSRGSAERISLVLDAAPETTAGQPLAELFDARRDTGTDTRTAATFDSLPRADRANAKLVIAAAVGVFVALGILGVILGVLGLQQRRAARANLVEQLAGPPPSGPNEVASGDKRLLVLVSPTSVDAHSSDAPGVGTIPTNAATPPLKPPASAARPPATAPRPPATRDPMSHM